MFKEIKSVNGTPQPASRGPTKPSFWWGSVSIGGRRYAKFIGKLPKGRSKASQSKTPLKLSIGEASIYRYLSGGGIVDKYNNRSDMTVWAFRNRLFETDADLTADDVMALALEAENKRRLQLEKAHALMAMRQELDTKGKRQPIPQDVKVAVWQRDQGRCVECGRQEDLEFDHIIPLAMGGSNTVRNLQLLCAVCNRRKGATLG